jgi:DNA-binding NarL/FixJ family response regulator
MRLLLVDDHLLFAQSLGRLLTDNAGVEVVGILNTGQTVLERLQDDPVDVVVSDWQMPDMSGLMLLTQIRERFPTVKVLILSMSSDADTVREAIRAGAAGFITKNADENELGKALHFVQQNEVYLSKVVLRELARNPVTPTSDEEPPLTSLTNRERDVLRLLVAECTTSEIADHLAISPHTVEVHRKNLLHKLNARNTVGLIKFALKSGLDLS